MKEENEREKKENNKIHTARTRYTHTYTHSSCCKSNRISPKDECNGYENNIFLRNVETLNRTKSIDRAESETRLKKPSYKKKRAIFEFGQN